MSKLIPAEQCAGPVPLSPWEEAVVWICDPDSIVNHEIRQVGGRCYWHDGKGCLIWDIRPKACRSIRLPHSNLRQSNST